MTISTVRDQFHALELASTPWQDPDGVTVLDDGPEGRKSVYSSAYDGPAGQGWVEQAPAASGNIRSMSLNEMLSTVYGGGVSTAAGIPMSPDLAMSVGTVAACVRVIAEDVAKLPVKLFRRAVDGDRTVTTPALDDPRHALLTTAPNDWMTVQELYEYMVAQAALRGAAYAILTRDDDADQESPVREILPLLPETCHRRFRQGTWEHEYVVTGYADGTRIYPPHLVWCLNGFHTDILSGANISRAAREAIALARSIEMGQARFHANDSRPSGLLSTKAALKPEQRTAIRDAWMVAYGPGGRGGVAVLGDDFDFKDIKQTAADSQVLENRQFQVYDICRFFRVHPWAVMSQNSTQAYASIEQTALAHIQHTILPWVRRVELSVHRDILGRDPSLFLKLNLDAIARSTLTDRVSAYANAVKVFMTPNEIREREDMDPITDDPDADRIQFQRNNTGLASPAAATPPAAKPKPEQPAP